jgi:tellurite resistance protein TerC
MLFEMLAQADFSSLFTREALYVVAALVVIEGLLSVDNALAIAALASQLDEKNRKLAVTIGYAGAYGFRILALLLASYIIHNHWLMAFGAGYLIWLMCNHFSENLEEEAYEGTEPRAPQSFAKTIAMIALLDLSLSFDNVVAAVAFARTNIYLVYLGVTIGIITLRLVAGYCIKLLAKHPWLEHTAFLLVGFVGTLLCVELYWDLVVQQELKFGGIFLILLGHLAYEKLPVLQTVFRPIAMFFRYLFAVFARTINTIFYVLIWPIRMLIQSKRKTE